MERARAPTGAPSLVSPAAAYGRSARHPPTTREDVFVHATAVEAAGMRALNEGDRVSFELEDDRKGRGKQAGQIQKA